MAHGEMAAVKQSHCKDCTAALSLSAFPGPLDDAGHGPAARYSSD